MRRRHRDAVAREPQRGLDEPRPRAAARARSRARRGRRERPARRTSRSRRRSGRAPSPNGTSSSSSATSRRLGAEPGNGDEAVEIPRAARGRVVVDRVAAAEEAGHHGLGDAGGERRGDRGVGRGSAVREDLGAGLAVAGWPAAMPLSCRRVRGRLRRRPCSTTSPQASRRRASVLSWRSTAGVRSSYGCAADCERLDDTSSQSGEDCPLAGAPTASAGSADQSSQAIGKALRESSIVLHA